jgi:hypothetical protein
MDVLQKVLSDEERKAERARIRAAKEFKDAPPPPAVDPLKDT